MKAWLPPPKHRLRTWLWRTVQAILALLLGGQLILLAAVLPFHYPTENLRQDRRGPLLVLDRHGTLLASVPASDGSPGRHGWVALDRFPSHAVLTVLASEDSRFFEHSGVDPWGILRAAWLNLKAGRTAYGGSTITMQLVRMIHSAGQPRSYQNKLKEIVLALRLERAMDKRTILEQYLNRAYFGNGAFGIEAAARTYFDKPGVSLSVGEATLLAVLLRAPTYYNPLRHLDRALDRRDHVLDLLVQQRILTGAEAQRARSQPLKLARHRPPFRAPHFVQWALSTLPASVRQRGGRVWTSLDLPLQEQLHHRLVEQVAELKQRKLDQAGLVVLDTSRGEVLSMIGSTGYDRQGGQINIVTRRRHPGSALKPFVYALALEQGESPASVAYDIHDVASRYQIHGVVPAERGPVRYREALAGSYNLAAVHVLEQVGVDRLLSRLRQAGLGPLQGAPRDYGLRLALGSAQVRLLDLAAAYGFLAQGGRVTPPRGILRVDFADGTSWTPPSAPRRRIFSPQVAWLVMDMLADEEARHLRFGEELPLDLPFRVAAKTGTARGFSDTVAIGVTRELTVAAWAGNFDGKPSQGLVAMQTAAPLVRAGFLLGSRGHRLSLPPRPAGLITAQICPLSGQRVAPNCPHRKQEYFLADHPPRGRCTWHRRQGQTITVHYPPEIERWARRQRRAGARHL